MIHDEELRSSMDYSEGQKKAAKRLFSRGFGDFWNGVSSGWEN